tara:strand:- start:3331 stop:4413 length:1083 start_codon:yes stop_codon:yes gene_type:complete
MSLATGAIIAHPLNSIKSNNNLSFVSQTNTKFLYYVLILISLISFLGIYLLIRFSTITYLSENYINEWMMIPNMIAVDRYAGILNYPFYIKYSLYFIYPGNLLAGLLFADNNLSFKKKILLSSPLIAAIILGIIEGSRTSILLGIILFGSAWMSTSMYKNNQAVTRKGSYLKFAFGIGISLLLFTISFIFIQWLRQGMDGIIFDLLIDRIRAYFFGYLAAFSKWLVSSNPEISFYPGFVTFAGPFNLLGIMERPLGFYSPINITTDISTNIFTAFRGIVSDFSIPGSILIAFIIGFISQSIFQDKSKSNLFNIVPISMFYAFTLYSPLISIFHYNSILFSWLILYIILILAKNESVDNYC